MTNLEHREKLVVFLLLLGALIVLTSNSFSDENHSTPRTDNIRVLSALDDLG